MSKFTFTLFPRNILMDSFVVATFIVFFHVL